MPRKIRSKLVITSTDGNDWVEGGSDNDTLTGGLGADKFVLRSGGGHDIVTDFNPVEDRVLFDYGSYSDILYFGQLHDGLEFDNFIGTAHFTINAADVNADGIMDTVIHANADSITLLGWAPDQLYGWSLMGG